MTPDDLHQPKRSQDRGLRDRAVRLRRALAAGRARPRPAVSPAPALVLRLRECRRSTSSRSSPVTRNTVCSATSTVLSPMRSSARAMSTMNIAHSRSSASSPMSTARRKTSAIELVDPGVLEGEVFSELDVARDERLPRLDDLQAHESPHVLDRRQHLLVTRRLVAGERHQLGDVHALVAHPLQAPDDVQQGGDQAKVAGHGSLTRQQRDRLMVDVEVAAVDRPVGGDDASGKGGVAPAHGVHGAHELFARLRRSRPRSAARAPRAAR